MWGFTIYLMRLADLLQGRKYSKMNKTCDVCKQKFNRLEDMEEHRRVSHPDAKPREGRSEVS